MNKRRFRDDDLDADASDILVEEEQRQYREGVFKRAVGEYDSSWPGMCANLLDMMRCKCTKGSSLEIENSEDSRGRLAHVLYMKGESHDSEDFRPDYVFDRRYKSVMLNMLSEQISVADARVIVERLRQLDVSCFAVFLNGQRIL